MTRSHHNYGTPWTRDESILAFDLYCRIPFRKTKATNPEVQQLATLLDRTPASVARKLGNFGAFDPDLKKRSVVGLAHTSKLDEQVWIEFHNDWNKLVFTASELRERMGESLPQEPRTTIPAGPSEMFVVQKQRLLQRFFREAVLSSFASTCCVTGVFHT